MSTFDPENPFGLPDLSPEDAGRLHDHVEALASEHGLDWRENEIGCLEVEGALGEQWFESPMLRKRIRIPRSAPRDRPPRPALR